MKATDVRILEVAGNKQKLPYRTPMKFGGRVVTEATVLNIKLLVQTRQGKTAEGFGSMPMGVTWAWPTDAVSPEDAASAVMGFAQQSAMHAASYDGGGHPLELAEELSAEHSKIAARIAKDMELAEPIPGLAQLMAASPVQAALFDAYGKVHGENVYNLLGAEFVNRDLAAYLGADFAGEHLDRYTLRAPKSRLPLYHLVGALDPLDDADVDTPIGDGLPETLAQWIEREGLTHLKIKLAGDDLAWDVARVASVDRVAAAAQSRLGRNDWRYSLDFNERCASVDYVLDFLGQLREQAPAALDRIHYIEQPTHRDLAAHPENKMHRASAIKPVVIDESLVDLASLELAREMGYSGVALKACKGHADALLMAAAAQKHGLFVCVQDLTCPGASFLHSATLAARIAPVAAIEGNARQYCPAGNSGWRDRYPEVFTPVEGKIETAGLTGPGLGY